MTLLKELIEIPESIQRGDYVLRLSEGVNRAQSTVDSYVVTEELVKCFDDALSFIRSALTGNTSKATYLHGSFGSGKSHFMAVLHLVLQGNPIARSITDLAGVIRKHNEWTEGKRFLLVPYHLVGIGADSMEAGVLGRYVEFVREHHPESDVPAVYLSEGLFGDAQDLRQRMGDGAFFAGLNEGAGGGDGWGELEDDWDRERFDRALETDPNSEARLQLISRLLSTYFRQYHAVTAGKGEAYVSLDQGLSVISRHAAGLGYDGLILFLDELILWLASHAADLRFVHQEAQKLAKLVEAQSADRPIPIVSFVARQRDLRDLVGDNVPGADKLNFSDALEWQEGRFHTVTLEDRNLPAIAEKRVLRVRSESARTEVDAAFEEFERTLNDREKTALLTGEGNRSMFRQVYPFSPALVQTLIALSSMLQRERTALKAMAQLLVEQRETIGLGDIVPVGDLFDVIAYGDEALSPELAHHFENAKSLYHQKLLPVLERQHDCRRDELEKLPWDDPNRVAFRNDDRLVKTLLLSALAPEVEALRGLNAERLVALNHGTIRTPIRGREGQEVLRRCKTWVSEGVGELHIGEEANPTISIKLTGVDTESIIDQARREDNLGNRIRRVRQILFEQLEITDSGEFFLHHEFPWRHTKRSCEVLFRNLRELPDTSLSGDDEWKLVIDFPFDDQGRSPRDDLSRLQEFRAHHDAEGGTKTIVWLPAFLSADAEKDLGMLVILEHALSGEWFGKYSSHLSPQDRQTAKTTLENQRGVLRQRVLLHLEAAYGIRDDMPASIDSVHNLDVGERFQSLLTGFEPQPPVAANLSGAMDHLLDQALCREFPAHPHFEADIKATNLRKVYEQVSGATQTEDGRFEIERPLRKLLREIAGPLLLGEMGYDATHFVLGYHWKNHFTRKVAETGCAMTVEQLREWIDQPRAMGLPREAENLVILIFAEQTNRSFYLHGSAYPAKLTDLPEKLELREETLPEKSQWDIAYERAGRIFGKTSLSPHLNASNVATLSAEVKSAADDAREACQTLCQRLRERLSWLGVSEEDSNRLTTSLATFALANEIGELEPGQVVGALADATIATSVEAMGTCFSKAAELSEHLDATNWEIFEALRQIEDERSAMADEICEEVRKALCNDEDAVGLATTLKTAQSRAVRLLTKAPPKPEPVRDDDDFKPEAQVTPGVQTVDEGTREDLDLNNARGLLDELDGKMTEERTIRLNIGWRIEEGGTP